MQNIFSYLYNLVFAQPIELVSGNTSGSAQVSAYDTIMAVLTRGQARNGGYLNDGSNHPKPKKRATKSRAAPRPASRDKGGSKPASPNKPQGSPRGSPAAPAGDASNPAGTASRQYVDRVASPIFSPGGSKLGPKSPKSPESPTVPGGISKSPRGSKSKTPPSSPLDPRLVKRNGRLVSNNLQVIPLPVLDGTATKRFPPINLPRPKGFWNQGNFCYRNAILQAMLHVPALYRYLGKMHKNCRNKTQDCVVCALQFLAQAYWNMPETMMASALGRIPGPLKPLRAFNHACKANPPTDTVSFEEVIEEFTNDDQSDAWYFVMYLLEVIDAKTLPRDDTSFADMFDMTSYETWTCGLCGRVSHEDLREVGMPGRSVGISIGIRDAGDSTTLYEILTHYFEYDNARRCYSDQCELTHEWGVPGPVRHLSRKIQQTPEVLIIHLRRFTFIDNTARKLNDRIQYDEYLNLRAFMANGEDVMYRLDGVVAHRGGVLSGHYIASMRTSDGLQFARANDDIHVGSTQLGRGSFIEMQKPQRSSTEFDPYILFYSRV